MSSPESKLPKPWEHAKSDGTHDALAERFVQSLTVDRRLYRHDIAGSVAHARMLHATGLLTDNDLSRITDALNQIEKEIEAAADDWPGWKPHLEDVHMCIEAALIEKIGDAGRKLHTGRSRNDQVALDLKLWIREAIAGLDERFTDLYAAFITLARRDGQVIMPSYTHLQRAQPITFGAELIAWLSAFERSQTRIAALRDVNRENPLGSGAVAGSALSVDRQHTADILPLGPPTASSIDATASRDAAIDFTYGLAMVAMTLSRWAEQWVIYATNEFSFLRLDQCYTTGSSMMPQKRNPDMLELIRGRCGAAYGHLVALLTICKGLGIGYQRDLQLDKQHLFATYDSVVESIEMAARIIRTARLDADAIASTLEGGFLDATSLAEYLVSQGVPFRTAHQIVGRLVRRCEDEGINTLAGLGVEKMNEACTDAGAGRPCDEQVMEWLGAANVVKQYRSAGNAGTTGFEEQLQTWVERLGAMDEGSSA